MNTSELAVQAMVLCTSRDIAQQAAEPVDSLAYACGLADSLSPNIRAGCAGHGAVHEPRDCVASRRDGGQSGLRLRTLGPEGWRLHRRPADGGGPQAAAQVQLAVLVSLRDSRRPELLHHAWPVRAEQGRHEPAFRQNHEQIAAGVFIGGLPMAEDLKLLRRCALPQAAAQLVHSWWLCACVLITHQLSGPE